jgi:hypothetical protein
MRWSSGFGSSIVFGSTADKKLAYVSAALATIAVATARTY